MLSKLGTVELVLAVKKQVIKNTGAVVYDTEPPKNAASPFYIVQFVGSEEVNTKMMFRDKYTLWVHAIGKAGSASAEIYKMIDALREAMTCEIAIPEPFELIRQASTGILSLKKDETDEWHGVVGFEFVVNYGFKVKI